MNEPLSQFPNFDKLWDFAHPGQTEITFRQLYDQLKDTADPSYLAQLQTQIGRTLSLQRKFDEAHKVLDNVQPQLDSDDAVTHIRYLLERGRTYNSSGEPEKAKPLFIEAWDMAREAKQDVLAVDAAHMVAIVEPPDEAIRWNETAVAFAEQSTNANAKNWLGSLYNNLGWSYFTKQEYATALDFFERDLEWFQERDAARQAQIAQWSIARVLRALGRIEEAFRLQNDLRAEIENAKQETDGYVYEELGECAILLEKSKNEITAYFSKAYELLSHDTNFTTTEPERLARLKEFAT